MACDAALAGAKANLSAQIAEAGAVIEAGPLPVVRAQLTLMTVVFQNLLGNALKFTGDQPPRIVITAERDGAFWSFSVTDNGIGIEPQYADRVFLIFQRLHDRAAYPGTGHRPGDVPEDHRVLRRPDLARHRRRGRRQVLLHRARATLADDEGTDG